MTKSPLPPRSPVERAAALYRFEDLLAAVPVSERRKETLRVLMSGSDRHYHDTAHLALLFDRHRLFAPQAGFNEPADTRLIASAIAFHDCVYTAGRADNEERSAQAWLEASADLDAQERVWVADTIRATSDHLGYGARASDVQFGSREALRLWMLDLDLTPFGETPDVFDRNALLLRAEAPDADAETFEAGRRRILRRFAKAPVIYRLPPIAARFDAQARANIARHLSEPVLARSADRDPIA